MTTPNPLQLSLATIWAREHGHDAARASAKHADRVESQWSITALQAVRTFATVKGSGCTFLAEEARAWAEDVRGVSPPPDGRAWGHVILKARAEGLIASAGYAPAKSSNGSPKVLWRVV